MYNFEYTKDGLKAEIDKDELAELMEQDQEDNSRRLDLEYEEECRNDRDVEQQEKYDSGMKGSDYL